MLVEISSLHKLEVDEMTLANKSIMLVARGSI